jgi:hypothetical protein
MKGGTMRNNRVYLPAALVLLIFSVPTMAQVGVDNLTPDEEEITEVRLPVYGPPGGIQVMDHPNDAGDMLDVSFEPASPVDQVEYHQVFRREAGTLEQAWIIVKVIQADEPTDFVDGLDPDFLIEAGTEYEYMIGAVFVDGTEVTGEALLAGVVPAAEWFHLRKIRVLIACAFFLGMIFYFFRRAQSGAEMYLRPIAGIEAIDEAIGRATEMGKPILYVPGLSSIGDVATIASLTILSRVAKKVAEYQTPLLVPNRDPIVYTVADETVKQAYLEAGRPDSYDPDSVFFLTDSQFAFVAGVNGIMMREKPATNFYLGMFWAESLILAETGSLSGAIQIAGTDATVQLPFFITTCDYTLIGEELYAASAYLGKEPKQLGAVKGQDGLKAVVMAFITLGFLMGIMDIIAGTHTLGWLRNLVSTPIVD